MRIVETRKICGRLQIRQPQGESMDAGRKPELDTEVDAAAETSCREQREQEKVWQQYDFGMILGLIPASRSPGFPRMTTSSFFKIAWSHPIISITIKSSALTAS
jgi:hypothetical protein